MTDDFRRKYALEEADRRLRHAAREYFPTLRTALASGSGIAALAASGTEQAVMGTISAVFAAYAIKSVREDAVYWLPAVSNWLNVHRDGREPGAGALQNSMAVQRERSPE